MDGPVLHDAVPPRSLVQSKLSPLRLFQEQKPFSKVQLLMTGGGVVGGNVGGTAGDGITLQYEYVYVMSSIAISPLTPPPLMPSNTI